MGWFLPLLASMAASMGSTALNNSMSKGGTQGYDLPTMPPSPYDATNQRLMAEIAQQKAINYQAGRLDPGMQILLDQIKKRQLQQSAIDMYGRPGDRGGSIMNNTMAMGSVGNVGPKAMMKQGSRAMNDYASRNSQIMNYMDSLAYSGLQKQGTESWGMMQKQDRSSEIPWAGQVVSMNTPGTSGNLDVSGVDWGSLFNGGKTGNTFNFGQSSSGELATPMLASQQIQQSIPQYKPLVSSVGSLQQDNLADIYTNLRRQ